MAALVLLLCSLATSLLILILKSRALDEAQQRAQGRQQLRRGPNGHIATSSAGSAARLQVRGGLFLLCGHLTALLLRSDSSRLMEPAGLAGEAAVPLILGLLLVALPALLPAAFERHRTALVGAARVSVFMASDVRNPRGLLFIFQRPPSPEILRDTWHLLLGTRVVAMFCTAVACPLPLIPHLLVSAFAVHRCRLSDCVCSRPLLQHPVWQRRIAAVHSGIHKLPLLVPERGAAAWVAHGPAAAAGAPADGAAALDCRVFVTFIALIGGLVAPTLLLARVHGTQCETLAVAAGTAGAAGTARAARAASEAGTSLGGHRGDNSRGSSTEGGNGLGGRGARSGSGSGRPGTICRIGQLVCAAAKTASSCTARCRCRAEGEAHNVLHHLCALLLGASGSTLSAAAWWMLVSLLWVTALLLEGAGPAAAAVQ